MKKSAIKSGFYGVCYKSINKYEALTSINGKYKYIGTAKDPLACARIYDKFIVDNCLDKHLNFPIYPENTISNTKQIQLTRGKFAIVDESDFDFLNDLKFSSVYMDNKWYAITKHDGKGILMHRYIMGNPHGLYIDHIDGNGLNNMRSNLRICTNSQNGMNRGSNKNTSSKFKGVSWSKKSNKWYVQITKDKKSIYYTFLNDEKEAALQYNEWAKELFGDFAYLNVID